MSVRCKNNMVMINKRYWLKKINQNVGYLNQSQDLPWSRRRNSS